MKKTYGIFFSLLLILFLSHFGIFVPKVLAGNCTCTASWGTCYQYLDNWYQYRSCSCSATGSDTCSTTTETCGAGNCCQVRLCTAPTSTPGPNDPTNTPAPTPTCAAGCYGAASGHNGSWKCNLYGAFCISAYSESNCQGTAKSCSEPFTSVSCGCSTTPTSTPTPTPAQCHFEGCSSCLSHPGYKYSYDPICSSGTCVMACDNQFPVWISADSTTDQYTPDTTCAAGCLSGTPTPTPTGTITPTPTPTGGPTNTPVPGCLCSSGGTCADVCVFEKFTDVNYATPSIKCSLSPLLFSSTITPSAINKNSWCQRTKRTKGDANGDGVVNDTDYYLYVGAANGGQIPATANPDFNGDGEVGAGDRVIIMKILKP